MTLTSRIFESMSNNVAFYVDVNALTPYCSWMDTCEVGLSM